MRRQRKVYFVAGTDTGVGKTYVTQALLTEAARQGMRTLGLKPVAAGAERDEQGTLRNEDAVVLQSASTLKLSYEQVNPVCLEAALAPHLAAQKAGRKLRLGFLVGQVRGSMTQDVDLVLVEGAGGWRTPLNEREYLSGLVQELNLSVILVVGLRLGCLNHARLTAEAIERDGLRLAGWVGNTLEQGMLELAANVESLQSSLSTPCLGVLPWSTQVPPGALDLAHLFL